MKNLLENLVSLVEADKLLHTFTVQLSDIGDEKFKLSITLEHVANSKEIVYENRKEAELDYLDFLTVLTEAFKKAEKGMAIRGSSA